MKVKNYKDTVIIALLSYKFFAECIAAIKNQYKKEEEIYKVLGGMDFDAFNLPSSMLMRTLGLLFDDKSDWIGYYVHELNFGKKYTDGTITETVNGKKINIKLKTTQDLFNLLYSNQSSKEEKANESNVK